MFWNDVQGVHRWRYWLAMGFLLSALVGCGTAPPTPPAAAVLYTKPVPGGDRLWGLEGTGKTPAHPVDLGLLGLVAQQGVAVPWDHGVAVTLGHAVIEWQGSKVTTLAKAAPGESVVMVFSAAGTLWAVSEPLKGSGMALQRVVHGGLERAAELPEGLVAMAGSGQTVALLDTNPTSSRVWWGRQTAPSGAWRFRPGPVLTWGAADGSIAWVDGAAVIPCTTGNQGGWWAVSPKSRGVTREGMPMARAPLAAVPTHGAWAVTVSGLAPWQAPGPGAVVPWRWLPAREVTTADWGSWILVSDGFAQGFWFDTKTRHFEARWQWTLPPGGVGRAVVPVMP